MKRTETTEDWLRRIGSAEAMEKRQEQRIAGKLNPQVKGPHGLGVLVGKRTGAGKKHSLTCECDKCIPLEIKMWIAEMKKWDLTIEGNSRPVTVIIPAKTPGKKAKKWNSNRGRSSN